LADHIVNTSPLCYLHRAGILHVMPAIFGQVIVPGQVVAELSTGRGEGYDLPDPIFLPWVNPPT
jgi:predicted nucleic acid-binding protein